MSSDNRYAAPQANVDKTLLTGAALSRPPPIVMVSVIFAALMTFLASRGWQMTTLLRAVTVGELPAAALLIGLVMFGVRIWLLLSVLRARNWARIALVALLIFRVLSEMLSWTITLRAMPEGTTLQVDREQYVIWAAHAGELIAAALLFTPAAARWFRERKAARLA